MKTVLVLKITMSMDMTPLLLMAYFYMAFHFVCTGAVFIGKLAIVELDSNHIKENYSVLNCAFFQQLHSFSHKQTTFNHSFEVEGLTFYKFVLLMHSQIPVIINVLTLTITLKLSTRMSELYLSTKINLLKYCPPLTDALRNDETHKQDE